MIDPFLGPDDAPIERLTSIVRDLLSLTAIVHNKYLSPLGRKCCEVIGCVFKFLEKTHEKRLLARYFHKWPLPQSIFEAVPWF